MMIHSAMKRILKVLCFFVVELGFFYSVFGASAPVGVRMGYPQPSGAMLPIWVMTEARLDHKYGFELQNIYISGGARLTQTLVSGDIDMASSGGAVVNAVLSGADIVGIAASVPTYGFSLYARPEIKDVSGLKGKMLGVMTKGASSDHAAVALLRRNNLQPGQDVKFLYLGGVREVLAALERGIVSAGVLSAPTTLLARRLGLKEIINIADLKLPYALFAACFPKLPYFTEEHIKLVLLVTDHPKAAAADPKDFFDNRFLKELEDSGFVRELYGQH